MRRGGWTALVAGVAVLALALRLDGGQPMLRAWLPAWLFAIGIPLGALALVMALELADVAHAPLTGALRRLLPALPLGCLLALPLLLHLPALYAWTAAPPPGFAGQWLRAGPFGVREAVFLLLWALLGVVFAFRPRWPVPAWRRMLAVFGLMLHLSAGTLWALDWAASLDPGFGSSAFGLLLLTAQCSSASAGAAVIAAIARDAAGLRATARPMLLLLGLWLFLSFAQYLIVWSADLPAEIVWYQQRSDGLGLAAVTIAPLCAAAVLLIALPRRFARRPAPVLAAAILVLVLHAVEALWLVNPAWGGHFAVSLTDWPPLLGAVAVVAGGALAIGARLEASIAEP